MATSSAKSAGVRRYRTTSRAAAPDGEAAKPAQTRRATAERATNVDVPADADELVDRMGPARSLHRRAAYRFSILANLYANALAEMYSRKFGLTMSDWKTLAIIGHYEPLHPSAIAERTSMVPEGVSRALDRLVTKGVVDRSLDKHDRRRVVVTLTRKGKNAFDQIEAVRTAMEEDFMRALSKTEREMLFVILDKLDSHAHKALASANAWRRYSAV